MGQGKAPSRSELRKQLSRLQRSSALGGSERMMALLRYLVDEVLAGRGTSLKESVIGNALYGRQPPYDPRIDSTVRVEARRLRQKLKEHYAGEGRSDPVVIALPTGSYIPSFSKCDANEQPPPAATKNGKISAGRFFETGAGAAVAIMPFRALSRGADDESFADGLTDEVAYALARSKGLRVVSRSTTLHYKDSGFSPARLAAELKVDAVLLGTVRRADGAIRVTIETSDVNGFAVWSDRFDAPDTDRVRLQEALAATVLSRVRFDSSLIRTMQARPGPIGMENHAKVYQARQLLDLQTPAALDEALDLFTQVANAAPEYARGQTGVADCYCDKFRLGLIDEKAAASAAGAAVRRALEIDPQSVEAFAAKATISLWFDRDPAAAEAGFKETLRLGEYARASRIYGVMLTMLARHEEAKRQFRQAREIEPFSAAQDIAEALSHYQSRRYDLLIDTEGTPWRRTPAPLEARVYEALAHVFGGSPEGARALTASIEDDASRFPDFMLATAEIEAWLGAPERGQRLLHDIPAGASQFAHAALASALNEEAAALAAIEATIDRRELSRAWFRTDVRFDRLRGSDRFTAQLARLNNPSPSPAN